jgi:type IV pilus assembly protein PilB
LNLDALGFEEASLKDIRDATAKPYGMLLVTGPTGSGKSTTLYSAIREVLTPDENIVTVEDPVEYQLEGVNQVQVSVKRGLTFAAALRSILRQDPDTILIGEIRDMGVDPFLVASSVACVAAQRLGKKLCEECKRPLDYKPPKDHLLKIGFLEEEIDKLVLHQAVGCPACQNKGYKGRFAILETLPLSEEVRRIIIKGGSALDIRDAALKLGMITLRRCGLLNVIKGRTSLEEVLKVTVGE